MTIRRTTGMTRSLAIRLGATELAEIDAAAAAAGEPRADYIRRATLDRARAPQLADRIRAALGR